jgi:hypothetical protein
MLCTTKPFFSSCFLPWLIFILFICAHNDWVISPPFPHPLLTPPYPSLPSRNYFALISNFVDERV